jgi:hypothetical protein
MRLSLDRDTILTVRDISPRFFLFGLVDVTESERLTLLCHFRFNIKTVPWSLSLAAATAAATLFRPQ